MTLANLKVSKCKRFALLFNSTGEYLVIWSKQNGRYMVEVGVALSVISEEDAKLLLSQIDASPLPDSDALVEDEVAIALANLNTAHASIPGYELDEDMIAESITFIKRSKQAKLN